MRLPRLHLPVVSRRRYERARAANMAACQMLDSLQARADGAEARMRNAERVAADVTHEARTSIATLRGVRAALDAPELPLFPQPPSPQLNGGRIDYGCPDGCPWPDWPDGADG